jgi:hypothetical protein
MVYTLEEFMRKYPNLSRQAAQEAIDYLNVPPMLRKDRWELEWGNYDVFQNYTAEALAKRHPEMTAEWIANAAAAYAKAAERCKAMLAANPDPEPLTIGSDGLTQPMRELNRFAEENALPEPFPPRKR